MSENQEITKAPTHESRMVQFERQWQLAMPYIKQLVPQHITPERIFSVAVTARQRNPELLECTDVSILRGIIIGAQLGLDVSGVGGKAFLVPFNNRNTGKKEAQFQVGWRGLVELARRTGQIGAIYAREVYENEDFVYVDGLEQILRHVPRLDASDPGKIVGVYAVAVWTNGYRQPEVMNRYQIDMVRKSSKASASEYSPWNTHYAEMAKKTVIKRLCKKLPDSVELQRVLDLEDHAEIGEPQPIDIDLGEDAVVPQTRTEKLVEEVKKRRGRPPKVRTETGDSFDGEEMQEPPPEAS